MNKKKLVSRTRHALYLRRRHNPQYRVAATVRGSGGVVVAFVIAHADSREAAREAARRWLADDEAFKALIDHERPAGDNTTTPTAKVEKCVWDDERRVYVPVR